VTRRVPPHKRRSEGSLSGDAAGPGIAAACGKPRRGLPRSSQRARWFTAIQSAQRAAPGRRARPALCLDPSRLAEGRRAALAVHQADSGHRRRAGTGSLERAPASRLETSAHPDGRRARAVPQRLGRRPARGAAQAYELNGGAGAGRGTPGFPSIWPETPAYQAGANRQKWRRTASRGFRRASIAATGSQGRQRAAPRTNLSKLNGAANPLAGPGHGSNSGLPAQGSKSGLQSGSNQSFNRASGQERARQASNPVADLERSSTIRVGPGRRYSRPSRAHRDQARPGVHAGWRRWRWWAGPPSRGRAHRL